MEDRAERSCEQQPAVRSQNPGDLTYCFDRVRNVLEHLGAQHDIERLVRHRDRRDVGFVVELGVLADRARLLPKVLGFVLAVIEELAVPPDTGADIQNPGAGRRPFRLLGHPPVTERLIVVEDVSIPARHFVRTHAAL